MSDNFAWTCPHCNHSQTANHQNYQTQAWAPTITETNMGPVGTITIMTVCLNAECLKISLVMQLKSVHESPGGVKRLIGEPLLRWRLIPESSAKPQPDYIPQALRDDYLEGCRIRDLSPKASATLARRCLQGMIRNFCGIAKGTLDQEITALEELVAQDKAPRGVTPESVEAIDHVRKIGNIGAHMEKDINLIIDIEPDEAQLLIELVETLFDEWYVARHERSKRFKGIADLRAKKDAVKKGVGSG